MKQYGSSLRSPKKEEHQVSDSKSSDIIDEYELEGSILGFEFDNLCKEENEFYGSTTVSWDFLEWDETLTAHHQHHGYNIIEEDDDDDDGDEDDDKMVIKRETSSCVGFMDDNIQDHDHNNKRDFSLNLNLNYEQVLDAWSDRGPLLANHGFSLSTPSNGYYMGEVPVMEEERRRREASVLRYKEKRQSRLFCKKIRYQVRKLNADKRPRLKGRFVKRDS